MRHFLSLMVTVALSLGATSISGDVYAAMMDDSGTKNTGWWGGTPTLRDINIDGKTEKSVVVKFRKGKDTGFRKACVDIGVRGRKQVTACAIFAAKVAANKLSTPEKPISPQNVLNSIVQPGQVAFLPAPRTLILEHELSAARNAITRLRADLRRSTGAIVDRDVVISNLKGDVANRDAIIAKHAITIGDLRARNAGFTADLATRTEKWDDALKRATTAEHDVADRDKTIADLHKQLGAVIRERNTAWDQLKVAREGIDKLIAHNGRVFAQYQRTSNELISAQVELLREERRNDVLREQIKGFTTQVSNLTKQVKDLTSAIRSIPSPASLGNIRQAVEATIQSALAAQAAKADTDNALMTRQNLPAWLFGGIIGAVLVLSLCGFFFLGNKFLDEKHNPDGSGSTTQPKRTPRKTSARRRTATKPSGSKPTS